MRISCLEPVLAPYSIPRFNALQALRQDWNVQVMALGATERKDQWHTTGTELGFEYCEAFAGKTIDGIQPNRLAARVVDWLEESDPQAVVVTGYFYRAMRAATEWARRRQRISIYMGDSQRGDRRRIAVREWLKGWWVRRQYDAAFVAGERAAAYLTGLGFPRERIWTGYDVVDNQAFAAGAAAVRSMDRANRAPLDSFCRPLRA